MTVLSVNVNKVAVLRNSRGGSEPSVRQAAETVIGAGAGGITVHPRPDLRHIRPDDVAALAELCRGRVEFNIEGNPFAPARGAYPGLLALVAATRPQQVTLVPDGDGQLTSDHGFDLRRDSARLRPLIARLRDGGARVALFMDAGASALELAAEIGAERIELYTGPFAEAHAAGAAGPAQDIHSDDSAGTHNSSATERAEARWFTRPARFMLAAAAAAALFVGGTFLGQALNDNQFESQQASDLAQINAADDSQRAATTTAAGQKATLVWSNELGISAVLVDNLPVLPSDQDYQLWYINGEGVVSAGTFDSNGDGTAWRVLDGTMHAGDQVGVTVEPNGGSDQPTSDPIAAFQS